MKNSFSNFTEFYLLYDESSLSPLLKYFIRILYNTAEKCDESIKITTNFQILMIIQNIQFYLV